MVMMFNARGKPQASQSKHAHNPYMPPTRGLEAFRGR